LAPPLHPPRSHPAILKIPNELFYDEELLPRADEMLRSSFCRWEHLPKMVMNSHTHTVTLTHTLTHSHTHTQSDTRPIPWLQDFPVIFHGVMGKEEREASSPSFFNRWEVDQLMDYVKKLMEKSSRKGRAKLSAKDIGIIAPYRKQVANSTPYRKQVANSTPYRKPATTAPPTGSR